MLPIDEFGAKGARENKSFTVKLWPNDGSYRGQTMVQVTKISEGAKRKTVLEIFGGGAGKAERTKAPGAGDLPEAAPNKLGGRRISW